MKRTIFLLFVGAFLAACEGEFAGNRSFQLERVSNAYRLRHVQIGGQAYLAVLNTSARDREQSAGSIHFYDLNDPANPKLNKSLSFQVPKNVGDFYYFDENDRVYVLDRNTDRLIIFERKGNSFEQLTKDGKPLGIKLMANPQSIVFFRRSEEQIPYLAITCFRGASIQFFNLKEERLLEEEDIRDVLPQLSGKREIYFRGRQDMVGASLDMKPRTKRITPYHIKESIDGISAGASVGQGINEILFLGGEKEVFVTASTYDTALFGFHLKTFDNTSNLLWNLPAYEEGREVEGKEFPGTGESGFRGLVADAENNIYVTSRSDESLYKIPGKVFEAEREQVDKEPDRLADRNTTAFRVNERPYRLKINFDSDPEDEKFPRLSALTVNHQENGRADRAYVLGRVERDGDLKRSRVYLVDLKKEKILDTFEFVDAALPEALYLLESGNLLYVSLTGLNSVAILDVSGDRFELIRYLGENPEEK